MAAFCTYICFISCTTFWIKQEKNKCSLKVRINSAVYIRIYGKISITVKTESIIGLYRYEIQSVTFKNLTSSVPSVPIRGATGHP